MKIKNLIVWAWLSWIVLAQKLAEKWEQVLIIEKRNHIWWNCFDYYDENWILIHKYWPHIFHTDLDDVWEYVNKFSDFTNYQTEVWCFVDWNLIPIPFNLNSISLLFPLELARRLENTLLKYFDYWSKVSILELKEKANKENNNELSFISEYVLNKVYKNYILKQWQMKFEDIDQDIFNRVPIVISKDNRYFPSNKFQWLPKNGYTKMFKKMLDNKSIKILLNTDYKDIINEINYEKLYFTWPIDEFFDYKYWELDYKKTLYNLETYDKKSFQEKVVISYPNDNKYTRITEFKKFYPESSTFNIDKTVICKEIPWVWEIEAYPVETKENLEILEKYKEEGKKIKNVFFFWRLANYKYMDMDKTIKNILDFKI